MTRIDLNKFDSTKLKPGKGRGFEVRSKTTGYQEYHYFYRFETGELFQTLVKGYNQALALKNQYAKELLEKKFNLSCDNGVDHVAFTGKAHLTLRGKEVAFCGRTAPFWYRVVWDGKTEGVCKRCIKVYSSDSQRRKIGKLIGVSAHE